MSNVKWSVYTENNFKEDFYGMEIAVIEPVPAFQYVSKNRPDSPFLKCPGFVDFCKNTFFVLSPYDLTLKVDPRDLSVRFDNFSQGMVDACTVIRGIEPLGSDNPFMVTLPPRAVFWSNDDVEMELMPTFLDTKDSVLNAKVVPGVYNIGKWVRPIEFTFEVMDLDSPVKIKRGTPLFAVRFKPADGSRVTLSREVNQPNLKEACNACVGLKDVVSNKSLKTVYNMAQPFLNKLGFGIRECPFSKVKKFINKILNK